MNLNKALLEQPPHLDPKRSALFLDLDGTIAEIMALPGDVGPQIARTQLLERLRVALNGRVAVLTGRTLAEADRILDKSVPALSAVHGLVRRTADGVLAEIPAVPDLARERLARVRASLELVARAHPGVVLEDKVYGFALHYRLAPEAATIVRETITRLANAEDLMVQNGAMVSELRTHGPDKGDALSSLMKEMPFTGSIPIMVGDDLTDEHAFQAAEALGGYGVLVGPPRQTHARYRLASVASVLTWLDEATL